MCVCVRACLCRDLSEKMTYIMHWRVDTRQPGTAYDVQQRRRGPFFQTVPGVFQDVHPDDRSAEAVLNQAMKAATATYPHSKTFDVVPLLQSVEIEFNVVMGAHFSFLRVTVEETVNGTESMHRKLHVFGSLASEAFVFPFLVADRYYVKLNGRTSPPMKVCVVAAKSTGDGEHREIKYASEKIFVYVPTITPDTVKFSEIRHGAVLVSREGSVKKSSRLEFTDVFW